MTNIENTHYTPDGGVVNQHHLVSGWNTVVENVDVVEGVEKGLT
jgi:hypothetical protein